MDNSNKGLDACYVGNLCQRDGASPGSMMRSDVAYYKTTASDSGALLWFRVHLVQFFMNVLKLNNVDIETQRRLLSKEFYQEDEVNALDV